MWLVEITSPDGLTLRARSRDRSLFLGSSLECKLRIHGPHVGLRHAEAYAVNGQVFVRNLTSSNGLEVNGVSRQTAGPLSPFDVLRVEAHEFRFRWLPEPIEEPAPPSIPPHAPMANDTLSVNGCAHDLSFNFRQQIQSQLVDAFGIRRVDVHRMADEELRSLTEKIVRDLIGRLPDLPPSIDREHLMVEVRDEAIGLGLLEPLLADPTISEIMVNAPNEIFVERSGRIQKVPQAFTSDKAVLGIIERIVAPIGRRIDESSPMVDARLKDGSRVNAVIPPLALKGPSLTIRKFSRRKLAAQDLLDFGSASAAMIEFLRVCVEQRKNLVISGGTGSGKTTLLNILGTFIPEDDRIVTIEDAAELQLQHPNQVALEARPANLEGKGHITIRDLVRNALRMRPDRIVVGECRGGEALDMLQAMNTGHQGSLTTAHANSPRDLLSRLEVMGLMAGLDVPAQAIREQIASAVDVIVQQSRLPCGARKITSIVEVTGLESGRIQLQELFAFTQSGIDAQRGTQGAFVGRGCLPEFYQGLIERAVPLDLSIFNAPDSRPPELLQRRAA